MTSTSNDWMRDLEIGKEGEKIVRNYLEDNNSSVNLEYSTRGSKSHDLEFHNYDENDVNHKNFKEKYGLLYEVKRDKRADETGNFYYEIMSNVRCDNIGCMISTKSDTLFIVKEKTIMVLNILKLKNWVDENKSNFKIAGSRKNLDVRGMLLPLKDLRLSPAFIEEIEY